MMILIGVTLGVKRKQKKYSSSLWISLPDSPGVLGEVTSLIGNNHGNLTNVEMTEKKRGSYKFYV